MLLGLLIAVIGAAGAIAGCFVGPWFTPTELSDGIMAASLPLGNSVVAAAALGGLSAVLAIVLRRRILSSVTLLSALSVVTLLIINWVSIGKFPPAGVDGAILAKMATHRLPLGPGFWYTFCGAALMLIGATFIVSAVKTWRSGSKLFRVSLLWNGSVVRQHLLVEPRDIEVGSDAHDGLIVPSPVLDKRYHMFRSHNISGAYDLNLKTGLRGTLEIGGQRKSVEEALAGAATKTIRLGPNDWGKFEFDDLQVLFQFVQPGATASGGVGMETWLGTAAALAVFTVLSFVAYLCHKYDPTFDPYQFAEQKKKDMLVDAEALALLKEKEEEKEEEEELDEEMDPSKQADNEEGKFGDPDIPDQIESKVPKNEGRMVDKIDPKKVGLVDILSSQKFQQMQAMSNILAANTNSLSSKLAIAMAGSGTEFVMGGGSGGMGFRGTGGGGGGDGGFGRIHGLGKIDAGGGGLGTGVGLGTKGMKKVGKINVGSGQSAGFCKKENISSVVRSRANAIRACYEARLQVNANLAGKLTARWTIGVDGRVTQASLSANTVSDGAVGNCVLGVVRRMQFAKPEGGVCIVQWPFVFNPG